MNIINQNKDKDIHWFILDASVIIRSDASTLYALEHIYTVLKQKILLSLLLEDTIISEILFKKVVLFIILLDKRFINLLKLLLQSLLPLPSIQ